MVVGASRISGVLADLFLRPLLLIALRPEIGAARRVQADLDGVVLGRDAVVEAFTAGPPGLARGARGG